MATESVATLHDLVSGSARPVVSAKQDVKGKTALVTGAGSGINLEFARLLLSRGCNVLMADLSLRPEAETLVSQYSSTSSSLPRAIFHKTDVRSWPSLHSAFTACSTHFPTLDIVCPGAGVFEPPWSSFWHPPGTSTSKDDLDGDRYALLDINLTHVIRATQIAISYFLNPPPQPSSSTDTKPAKPASPTNPKTVVLISSIAGESASLLFPLYHASKWGVMGFTRSLADLEGLFGIRVAAVAPGVVKTPLWTDNVDKLRIVKEGTGEGVDDWVTPEDVAKVMLAIVAEDEIASNEHVTTPFTTKQEKIRIKGGSVLEVAAHGRVRDVPLFGNTGPTGIAGNTVSNVEEYYRETVGLVGAKGWGVPK